MSELLYIGFDGGGSNSRYIIQHGDAEPEIFSYEESIKYSDKGHEVAAKQFVERISQHISDPSEINIVISLSGAGNEEERKQFEAALRNLLSSRTVRIYVESDSSFLLRVAYPEESDSGLVTISGTGSVHLAKSHDGTITKIGGWGRLLGDEGSGYWLGLQALKHYARAHDGIEPAGELYDTIDAILTERCNGDRDIMRKMIYTDQMNPSEFATVVIEAASADDIAKDMITDAALSLAQDVRFLWNMVEDNCAEIITVHGKMFSSSYYRSVFVENINDLKLDMHQLSDENILHYALDMARSLS
jgi:N-acetylglucosamine kinase-like BadF-type ATPase